MTQPTDYEQRVMMKDLVEIARYIFMNRVDIQIYMCYLNNTSDQFKNVLDVSFGILYGIHFRNIMSVRDVHDLARRIEANPFMAGLVFDGSSEFFSHYLSTTGIQHPDTADSKDALYRLVADALSITRQREDDTQVALSEEYMNRGADFETWYNILVNNPWMVFVYVLGLTYVNPAEIINMRIAPPSSRKGG